MQATIEPKSEKDFRQFGLLLGGMLALVFGLLIPWLWSKPLPLWPWVVGGGFWVWALALPTTLGPVERAWIKMASVLAWINTRLILGVAFFLFILPASLIMRLLGKDPLQRRFDPAAKSYCISKAPLSHNNIERPF